MEIKIVIYIIASFSIGSIVGFFYRDIIKPYIEHRLARHRGIEAIRITQKMQVIASFRAAFAPTLAVIDVSKKVRTRNQLPSDIDTALWNALLKQATEIELLRPYISKQTRTAYQEAWDKYIEEAGNYGFETTTFRTDVDNPCKIFEDLIHDILQFADNES